MYEGLRLTELHEEMATYTEASKREGGMRRKLLLAYIREREAEVRRRVAAQQPAGAPPRTGCAAATVQAGIPLKYGIPDAVRRYPGRYDHWSCHARHAVPVESCHLCHQQPTRWTPGGFVHEEHIPCE